MKRVWGHVLTGLMMVAGTGAAGGLVPACVHDNSSIFVSNVLAPQYVSAGMACSFTADPTQPVIATGTLDLGLVGEYSAVFLVGNQLVPRGDPNQPQTETAIVTIEGAVIRVVDSNGNQLSTYTQPVAATIPPSSGTTPGYASMAATIIDRTASNALIGALNTDRGSLLRVVSNVRFFGHTLGGDSVESGEFGFPVDVCYGCLVSFPLTENDNNLPTPNCKNAGAASSSSSSTSVPCVTGQDLPVDCSTCVPRAVCEFGVSTTAPTPGGTDAGAD
jgi:hypothetical protein